MARYIELDAVVAEIEKRIKYYHERAYLDRSPSMAGREEEDKDIISILETLEVKKVDVDVEKEFSKWWKDERAKDYNVDTLYERYSNTSLKLAKHFLELGMRVNNPITAADRGTAEEIIINLKRVEQDYCIDLTKEIEWIRNKVKKGE